MVKTNHRAVSLTETEQEALMNACESYEDMALFKLALTTGIRREDIVKIEIGRINLEAKTLFFWEAKKKRDWAVPLTEEVAQMLRRHIATKQKGARFLFDFTGRTAYNKLQRTLQKAGIKKHLRFHDMRRTFMKTARRRGISQKAVSQITGDSLSVIERYYQNLDMEELKEEVAKLL